VRAYFVLPCSFCWGEIVTRADLIVVGLGYVGLPLAREAARSGIITAGYDINPKVVSDLNAGRSHVGDVSDADVAGMRAAGFRATSAEAELPCPDTVVICVPTPLSAEGAPDLSAVRAAVAMTGRMLRAGMLVVLESTTYPGTTDEIVRPMLEKASGLTAGADFALAFSPERIDPGNASYGIRNTPKIVGGQTSACTEVAARFYGKLCDQVVRAKSAREAEMAKLLENTYRHVNIALVNEMAIFCHELGVDLWDAIDCAATKPFGFHAFRPGPGVGGHCIPIDPNYLSFKVRTLGYPFRLVELAQEINTRMPSYVAERAAAMLNEAVKPVNGARVLILGVSYKPDVADQRESPAKAVARRLRASGAELSYHDPCIEDWHVNGTPVPRVAQDLYEAVAGADLVVLLQDHAAYDLDRIAREASLLLDTRGRTTGPRVEAL
jgi:UDP-N-acetyl-D-glucosamine dehydrogenase